LERIAARKSSMPGSMNTGKYKRVDDMSVPDVRLSVDTYSTNTHA